ncbi:hypothetical protein SRIMM317S_03610 [Streptomyces rimosus subsp. rimosus]
MHGIPLGYGLATPSTASAPIHTLYSRSSAARPTNDRVRRYPIDSERHLPVRIEFSTGIAIVRGRVPEKRTRERAEQNATNSGARLGRADHGGRLVPAFPSAHPVLAGTRSCIDRSLPAVGFVDRRHFGERRPWSGLRWRHGRRLSGLDSVRGGSRPGAGSRRGHRVRREAGGRRPAGGGDGADALPARTGHRQHRQPHLDQPLVRRPGGRLQQRLDLRGSLPLVGCAGAADAHRGRRTAGRHAHLAAAWGRAPVRPRRAPPRRRARCPPSRWARPRCSG